MGTEIDDISAGLIAFTLFGVLMIIIWAVTEVIRSHISLRKHHQYCVELSKIYHRLGSEGILKSPRIEGEIITIVAKADIVTHRKDRATVQFVTKDGTYTTINWYDAPLGKDVEDFLQVSCTAFRMTFDLVATKAGKMLLVGVKSNADR